MRGIRASLEGRPRRALGQFFTPDPVAAFAVQTLQTLGAFEHAHPPRVIDPAAGEGVFLRAVRRLVPQAELVGLDLDPSVVGQDVHLGNGLLCHEGLGVRDAAFDVAVGNPPYGGLGLVELLRLSRGEGGEHDWEVGRAVLCDSELWRIAGDGGDARAELEARTLTQRLRRQMDRAFRFPIENLFVERFVRLLKPGGWLAVVVPEGLLANARSAFVREWMAARGRVAAVIGLPRLFARAGASARTAVLFFQCHPDPAPSVTASTVRLADPGMEWYPRGSAPAGHRRPAVDLGSYLQSPPPVEVAWSDLRSRRWDPQFWDPRWSSPLNGMAPGRTAPLGDFITHMTYGPIVTRCSPIDRPGRIPIVSQGQIEESGVNLSTAVRVAEGCVFDLSRSRIRSRDLLFPRSGAGSLGRNRLAVYEGEEPANIGCFVNLIRLKGINPYFVWLFLKTRYGWGQLRRIINGVGMPNISFNEIRSLLIPVVDEGLQQSVEEAYGREVRPAHQALLLCADGVAVTAAPRAHAQKRFATLVSRVERALTEGSSGSLVKATPEAGQQRL